MKSYLYLVKWILLITMFSLSVWGQEEVRQGEFHTFRKGSHQGFILSDSTGVYSIQYQRTFLGDDQRLYLHQYGTASLNFVRSTEIFPAGIAKKDFELKEIFSIKDQLLLVMTEVVSEEQKRVVLQVINKDGTHQKRIIADTLPSQKSLNDDFEIVVDDKEENFLIATDFPISSDTNQILQLRAFGSDLKEKWVKKIVFPDLTKQFLFSDWQFDGEGKVFFLARHVVDLFQQEAGIEEATQNSYHMWGYDRVTDRVKEVEVALNNRYILQLNMRFKKNQWVLAGLYSGQQINETKGIFNLILDSNLSLQNHFLHDFTTKEYERFGINRYSFNSKLSGLEFMDLQGIEILENGDFVLYGEETQKVLEEPSEMRGVQSFNEVFYQNDLTLFWFNERGKEMRIKQINKRQISVNDGGDFGSFFLQAKDSSVQVFYNENPKVFDDVDALIKGTKTTFGGSKLALVMVELNGKDDRNTYQLTRAKKTHRIRPTIGAHLLNGKTYFMVQKRRKKAVLEW